MANKSRTQYSVINTLAGIGGYFINMIVGFVCRMVFVRCLADDYLGISGLFTNILSMLSLAELGIGAAIVYALYKPIAEDDKEKIASYMQYYGRAYRAIGCVIAVLGLLMMPFLNFIVNEPPDIKENLYFIYFLYLFNTVITYFFSYRSTLLTASQQHYIVTGINYLFTIVQSVLQMIFLVVTKEYIFYLLIQIFFSVTYSIVVSQVSKKKFPYTVGQKIKPLEKDEKKKLTSNIKALTIWKLSGVLVNNTDNLIITYFSGMVMVGYTSNYTLLSGMITSLLTQLFGGITASVGNFNAVESKDRKLYLFNSLNLANFWVYGWAAIGIFLVSGDLVGLLYGDNYILPMNIPFIIALNFYMVGMQNAVWTFKNTLGLFKQGRYLLFITAAINLIASIVLGKIWGVFGILCATAISRIFTNTWYDPYAVFKYGLENSVKLYFINYLKYACILAVCGICCFFLCELVNFGTIINIILKIAICTAIPNAFFWLIFHKRAEYMFFKSVFKRITSRILKR